MKIKFGDNSLNLKVDGSLANIDRGPRGYSAYEIAVQEGFVGTEEEWLASLVGPEGKQGKDGERGIQGPRGQQGDKGDKGDIGPQGDKGDRGDTGPQGDKGEKGDIGPQGEKGDTGPSNVLSIGSVTKGDEANATITGESPNQILNLVLPKGDKGEKGEKGDTGPQGETGATGNGILSIQKTATAGLVDTYTTTFTDGTTTTFDITNGEDGEVTQKQLDETNENVSWLQTLTDQMPHVAGQGTDLSLESVLNYRLMKFLPQGVSSQESTTGKNLLDVDSDLEFTRSKTLQVNIPAGTYHVTNNGTTASDDSNRVTIRFNTNNKTYNLSTSTDYTVTLSSTETTIYLFSHTDYPASAGVSATIKDLMLSVDGGTYEPYTDGPAPSPSYPYPVKVVTGENSLVICNENLLNIEDGTYSASSTDSRSITFKDGVGTPSFTSTSSALYIVVSCNLTLKAGTYTLQGFTNSSYPYIQLRNGTTIIVATVYGDNNKKTFTLSEDAKIDNVRFYFGSSLSNIGVVKPMIAKGGSIPDVFASYQEQNYQLSLGNIELNSTPDGTIRDGIKGSSDVSYNLFDKNNVIKGNYQINSSRTLISSNSNRTLFIPCKPNTTYAVSKKISNYFTIGFINEEPSANISVTGYMRNASLEYLTSTSDSDSKYLACWYYNTGETLTEQEILDSIQITEGSEAKPYFPYGQVGMWYKREYIRKAVLDGSENWTFVSNSAMKFSLNINGIAKPVNQNTLPKMLSDNFRQSTWNNAINSDDDYLMVVSSSNEILRIKDNDFSTLADFKAWLSTHNTTIYYPLAQYTDIPITNTTLINQLNNIYNNAHSYNGVTNITTTYEDGNEKMYLDVEALAKGGSSTAETDPIFSASASAGITSSDITNWNGKASTTYVDTAISNAITNTLGGSY